MYHRGGGCLALADAVGAVIVAAADKIKLKPRCAGGVFSAEACLFMRWIEGAGSGFFAVFGFGGGFGLYPIAPDVFMGLGVNRQ